MLDLLPKILPNILGITANWGRWSEMVAAKLPDIMSRSTTLENILSKRLLQWIFILVGCKINWKNELEAGEYKNSLV